MQKRRDKSSSGQSPAKKRFRALVAAVELAQSKKDFELAMQICTPMQTRKKPIEKQALVREQAENFMHVINDETAKLNQQIRVKAHQLKCKQRKIHEFFKQEKALAR